jgi:hypothetical protein
MPDVSTRWMSYADLGEVLGIGSESARQLAIRRKWARQKGNDRKTRVAVPEEELRTRTGSETGGHTDHDPDARTVVGADADTVALRVQNAALEVEVRMLRAMFDDLRAERERWREQAGSWQQQAERLAIAPPVAAVGPRGVTSEPRGWLWPWRRAS